VLEVQANRLQVIRVPPCGWTDLGTPQRVETTLRSIEVGRASARRPETPSPALLFDLGAHYALLGSARWQGRPRLEHTIAAVRTASARSLRHSTRRARHPEGHVSDGDSRGILHLERIKRASGRNCCV
jgi:hypothetical protein